MKIVCASSVLFGEEAFSTLGKVVMAPEEAIAPELLRDADVLITRSKTHLGEDLLRGSSVKFVGTATAGVDHVQQHFLEEQEIAWASAPGCNANSVGEYVVTCLLGLVQKHGLLLEDLTLGVIGAGHTGTAVAQKARTLGLKVLLNDPPLALAEKRYDLVDLDELLQQANVISLHVPLTNTGPFATEQMANYQFFERIQPGSLLIHACRGPVVHSDALLLALERKALLAAAVDVWESEPRFRIDVMDRVDFATPHIAGYSYDGKLKGTMMVYNEACGFFERPPIFRPEQQDAGYRPTRKIDGRGRLEEDILWEVVGSAYDVEEDDRRLRAGAVADDAARGAFFSGMRRTYGHRREFPFFNVQLDHCAETVTEKVVGLGFDVVGSAEG